MLSISAMIASAWPARLPLFQTGHASSEPLLHDIEACSGPTPPGACLCEIVTECSSDVATHDTSEYYGPSAA